MKGEETRRRRDTQQNVYTAWHIAAFERQKNLPALEPILRKMGPPMRDMSPGQLRAAVMGIAKAMNAKVIYRKRET